MNLDVSLGNIRDCFKFTIDECAALADVSSDSVKAALLNSSILEDDSQKLKRFIHYQERILVESTIFNALKVFSDFASNRELHIQVIAKAIGAPIGTTRTYMNKVAAPGYASKLPKSRYKFVKAIPGDYRYAAMPTSDAPKSRRITARNDAMVDQIIRALQDGKRVPDLEAQVNSMSQNIAVMDKVSSSINITAMNTVCTHARELVKLYNGEFRINEAGDLIRKIESALVLIEEGRDADS